MGKTFNTGAAIALAVGIGAAVAAGGALAHGDMGPMPSAAGPKAAWLRHEHFHDLGGAFKALTDELKKDTPDKAVVATNAAKVKAAAGQLPSWFPKGSGAESKFKTDAKGEVWSDANGFAAAANRLQVESSKLNALAAAGDIAGVKGQVRAVGGACKGCHDKYRVPEKS
jgi:cytochrome c556